MSNGLHETTVRSVTCQESVPHVPLSRCHWRKGTKRNPLMNESPRLSHQRNNSTTPGEVRKCPKNFLQDFHYFENGTFYLEILSELSEFPVKEFDTKMATFAGGRAVWLVVLSEFFLKKFFFKSKTSWEVGVRREMSVSGCLSIWEEGNLLFCWSFQTHRVLVFPRDFSDALKSPKFPAAFFFLASFLCL